MFSLQDSDSILFKLYSQKFMLIAITVSFVLVLTSSCDTSHNFDGSSCIFYMNYVDDNCTNFNFSDCTWDQCVAWVSIRGVVTCLEYETQTSSDWNSCTQTCCDSGSTFSQTSDGIIQCQNSIARTSIIVAIVVGSIVGAILFMALIIILCIKCKQRFFTVHPQQIVNSLAEINRWKEVDSSKPPLKTVSCCVCLEEGCFFELECLHTFHRQCILNCLKNKKECILCRKTTLQTVYVYCQKCFKFYYQSPLNAFIDSSANTQQICQKCKNQGSKL